MDRRLADRSFGLMYEANRPSQKPAAPVLGISAVKDVPAIAVQNLSKRFGRVLALGEISFQVPAGTTFGLLGRNGAGKTTLLRILTGYFYPTSGTVVVGGLDVMRNSCAVRRRIGYVCEDPKLYLEMPVRSFLRFVARLREIEEARIPSRMNAVIDQFGLGEVANRLIGNLSKGYRQRVSLAQALLHEPEILVCDEPTAGLDPAKQLETRDLLRQLGASRTLIVSTHNLNEAATLCHSLAVLDGGRMLVTDTVEHLGGSSGLARLFAREMMAR